MTITSNVFSPALTGCASFVSVISTNPAKLMGLYPRKGTIAPGSDADFTIIDPQASRTIDYKELASNCDWSPFQGWKLWGFPETTVSRGEVIARKGKFVGKPGRGRFLKRKPFGWKELSKPWRVTEPAAAAAAEAVNGAKPRKGKAVAA